MVREFGLASEHYADVERYNRRRFMGIILGSVGSMGIGALAGMRAMRPKPGYHTEAEYEWERFSSAPNITDAKIREFLETYKNTDHEKIAEEARKAQDAAEPKKDQDLTIDALAKWYVACARQHQTESQVDRGYLLAAGNIGIGHILNHVKYDTALDISPLFRVVIKWAEGENRTLRPYIIARDGSLEERGSEALSAIQYEQGKKYSLFGTPVFDHMEGDVSVSNLPNSRIADMKEIDALLGQYRVGVPPRPMLISPPEPKLASDKMQIMLYQMTRG